MPPTKKSARKAAKKTTKRAAPRGMTTAHKRALAEGRAMSATVDEYLVAIGKPKRRGRKITKATLETRLVQARSQSRTATGVEKLIAAQTVRDLQDKIVQASGSGADLKGLEADFIRVAKHFGENRNISYGAWRDVRVSADVLKRAGIARNRG